MTPKRTRRKDMPRAGDIEPKMLDALNAMIATAPALVPGAKRAVLGEGPAGAAIAFVGEQPGDREDRQGRPFVGPAGQLLDRAMAEAGIDRSRVYVTNAIKHFKFRQRGKRRIHQKPTAEGRALPVVVGPGIEACAPQTRGRARRNGGLGARRQASCNRAMS